MNMAHWFKCQKGVSVLTVVLIMSILSIIGAVFVSFFTTGVEVLTGEVGSGRALFIADGAAEAAMGRLNASPASTNWLWSSGYLNKTIGGGTANVEVLQHDPYPSQTTASPYCIAITPQLLNTGANPARTILASVKWDPSVNPADLGVELYNADLVGLGTCATPGALPVASSVTSNNPETIRYRIPEPGSFPATVTYTVRVVGNAGGAHSLAVSYPDKPGFSTTNDARAVISAGKSGNARREIFVSFRRQPC
ncbi:MAG: hypothetical protein HZB22_00355 [Deltaproteobacteria bacterium]|nr:hypothetical protein [Deltaproteobacteria bacterium]